MARMICVDVDKRITFEEIQARCTPRADYPLWALRIVACMRELRSVCSGLWQFIHALVACASSS